MFDGGIDDTSESALYKMFSETISVAMDKSINHSHNWWIEDIEDPLLVQKIKRLTANDLELLTLFAFDGYTLTEIGKIYQCTPQNIHQKYRRIKNNLV